MERRDLVPIMYQVKCAISGHAIIGTSSGLGARFGFCLKPHGDFRINTQPVQLDGPTKIFDDGRHPACNFMISAETRPCLGSEHAASTETGVQLTCMD